LTRDEAPGSIAAVKVREIIKLIEADGWFLDRTRGSHRQYNISANPVWLLCPTNQVETLHGAC
jgi:predicted RNA binding protein YcfA (HicA-like mRNA interferase family)